MLPHLPFTVLDTETTGFVPKVHRIIEFASVRYENGEKVDEYETLISIPGEVPPPVEVLTRIRTADLEGKKSFDELRTEITNHIGEDTLIVGQNVGFDINMLNGEEIDLRDRPWIDTSMLASLVYPELASYSLGYMSTVLGLHHTPVHRALGDVHATTELFEKIWAKFGELPQTHMDQLKNAFAKGSSGYQLLADSIPSVTAASPPVWLTMPEKKSISDASATAFVEDALTKPAPGSPVLLEEPLRAGALQSLVDAAAETEGTQIIAVKNLDAALLRLSVETPHKDAIRILFPPWKLIDPATVTPLQEQNMFSAAEATLAVKLAWYAPRTYNDFPIHGDEKSVWNGKISCTKTSAVYRDQFNDLPSTAIIDHQQLLNLITEEKSVIPTDAHIIVTDASMLEDTATAAFDRYCSLDDLRAGSEGDEELTRTVDLLQIWIEKTRDNADMQYITSAHLGTSDASGLRDRLATIDVDRLSDQLSAQITALSQIVDPQQLAGRITWIEQRQNGSQILRSAPEDVAALLKEHLFSRPTTLLIPTGTATTLTEIIKDAPEEVYTEQPPLPVAVDSDRKIHDFFSDPPAGKSIVLVSSRKTIEEMFIKYTEVLEDQDITLICQNWGGGQGRMEAEFTAASEPAIWVMTPWMYEGLRIGPGLVDQLVLQSVPFDFPSHPVFSKRSNHYKNAFMEYSIPRLEHRLFRLLRTFCKHKKDTGEVIVIDERLKTKRYGERVQQYLEQFQHAARVLRPAGMLDTKENEESDDQLSLF